MGRLVERVNRFLKSSLRKVIEDQKAWSAHLFDIQYVINNTYHKSIKSTPSKVLLGYEQKCHIDNKFVQFLNKLANIDLHYEIERDKNRKLALEATEKIRNYNKIYYDKKHKKPSKYNPGDFVWIRNTVVKSGEDRKLKPAYKGPYLVAKVLNNNRYVVQDIPGFNVLSRPYNSILSTDRMKLWIKPSDVT